MVLEWRVPVVLNAMILFSLKAKFTLYEFSSLYWVRLHRGLFYAFSSNELSSTTGWIEFPLNLFVVVSYLLDPVKRRYPTIFPLFVSISYLIGNFFTILVRYSQDYTMQIFMKNKFTHTIYFITTFFCLLPVVYME